MTGYNRAVRKFVSPEFITGNGAREFAGNYSLNFNLEKVLLVTDSRVRKCSWMSLIADSLSDNGVDCEFFSSVTENPSSDEVMEGAEAFNNAGCEGIVAVGGGSVLDCAKGIGIITENSGHISEYIGIDMIPNPMPPLICIPSTAGSSADVSQYAVISDRKLRTKNLIISKSLVPDLSLLDPVTLSTLPGEIAKNSAMDALIHAIEGYCSNGSSPVTDTFAISSIETIVKNIAPGYWKHPDRGFAIMIASLYAGLCFSNAGLGLVHSMAHAIGGWTEMNHGIASFIVARDVIEFNMETAPERYHKIAREFVKNDGNRIDDSSVPDIIGNGMMEMFGYDERPRLSDMGITEEDIPEIVRRTMDDPCVATNPRIPRKEEVEGLYLNLL
jgi:alcohol dehydrogenase